ncbi:MAG: hypothetical protein DRG83_06090 [Deltaproteobacteria bacterium]|nr:MAG: hypothetical protein DRG83_06090 [Deltaproteobacteria bacterium]
MRHTPDDSARVFGGGIMLVTGPVARNGSDLSFKRMHFRGKDWATIWMGPHEHVTDLFLSEFRGEKVPVTINIAPPPSTLLVAAASFVHTIVPYGSDELGFAGALQGAPVEIVKAKTVDAYAIANAEVVIEGYLTPERVWETSEAEEKGPFADREEAPDFFPEWHGYMGKTLRVFKFQATAMTHREDPIFFTPHARSLEADILTAPFREACFLELFDRLAPGLVTDVNVMPGVASWAAFVIFQIKKRWPREEGLQKLLLSACFQHPILQLAIVVDDDVDIYEPRDILWALATRLDPDSIVLAPPRPDVFHGAYPAKRGIGIDATIPLSKKEAYKRPRFPTWIDLEKWIPSDVLEQAKSLQSDYAKMLARTGH